MSRADANLFIPQPEGDPVELFNKYNEYNVGQPRKYSQLQELLGGEGQTLVAPHLLAHVVDSVDTELPVSQRVQIAKDYQAADEAVREPSIPLIYRLHCEDAAGVTPTEGTTGFRVVDRSPKSQYPHYQAYVATDRQYRIRKGPNFEHEEEVVEGKALRIFQPHSFLLSGEPEAVEKFLDNDTQWGRVIVGHEAVKGFLWKQGRRELIDKDGITTTRGLISGWATLASSALRRLGYDSPIGKHGDFVHQAGIEGLADIVASGHGYEREGVLKWGYHDVEGMVLRRLAGIEFVPEEDAKVVGQKATERAFSEKGKAGRLDGLLYGDKSDVESQLTETAGRFMDHLSGLDILASSTT